MTPSSLTSLAARAEAGSGTLAEHDLYYLRSIYGQLREIHGRLSVGASALGREVLADNTDWLDCFIDKHTRALAAQQQDRPMEGDSNG